MTHYKKFNTQFILFIFFSLFSISALSYQEDQLVLDMRNVSALPQHFRVTSNALSNNINATGFADLHIAGSGQFSKLGLQNILKRIPSKHITIIDLRQESHGFLNGNAISWYAPRNAGNAGLTMQQIENNQNRLLAELDKEAFVKAIILTKTPDQGMAKTKTIEFSVHNVSSERELAELSKLNYERIYVQDHRTPNPKQVDRFIQIVKRLPKDKWIYFHCRDGVGRTTTFMTMYDILKNAKQVSFEDIIARQVAIGGKDFAETSETDSTKSESDAKRLDFLKQFYQYAKENKDNFDTTFSRWNKKNTKV